MKINHYAMHSAISQLVVAKTPYFDQSAGQSCYPRNLRRGFCHEINFEYLAVRVDARYSCVCQATRHFDGHTW